MKQLKFHHSLHAIGRWTYNLLVKWGVPDDLAAYVNLFALLFVLIILMYILQHMVKYSCVSH